MTISSEELATAKCAKLTPEKADAMFFPGKGGKPHKTAVFCSDCPLYNTCLADAIKNDEVGFWAGMSERERDQIRRLNNIITHRLEVPEDPYLGKRKVYLKVFTSEDYHSWMDVEVGPTEEDLQELEPAL